MMIPEHVARYLKSYKIADLEMSSDRGVYLVAIEVIHRGGRLELDWLYENFGRERLRRIFKSNQGAAMSEEQRAKAREVLDLSEADIPKRFSFGW